MWPSVPAFRSFANITCPSGETCELPHCIFSHDTPKPSTARRSPVPVAATYDSEPIAKRLKLDDSTKASTVQAAPAPAQANVNVLANSDTLKIKAPTTKIVPKAANTAPPKAPAPLPVSATRPVSPPLAAAAPKVAAKPDAPVALMPRKLNKEPATFTKRVTLLKALHTYMKPQNDKLLKAVKPEVKALHLSPNQLNKLAVDEEGQAPTTTC